MPSAEWIGVVIGGGGLIVAYLTWRNRNLTERKLRLDVVAKELEVLKDLVAELDRMSRAGEPSDERTKQYTEYLGRVLDLRLQDARKHHTFHLTGESLDEARYWILKDIWDESASGGGDSPVANMIRDGDFGRAAATISEHVDRVRARTE